MDVGDNFRPCINNPIVDLCCILRNVICWAMLDMLLLLELSRSLGHRKRNRNVFNVTRKQLPNLDIHFEIDFFNVFDFWFFGYSKRQLSVGKRFKSLGNFHEPSRAERRTADIFKSFFFVVSCLSNFLLLLCRIDIGKQTFGRKLLFKFFLVNLSPTSRFHGRFFPNFFFRLYYSQTSHALSTDWTWNTGMVEPRWRRAQLPRTPHHYYRSYLIQLDEIYNSMAFDWGTHE